MNKHEIKKCPRCKASLECKQGNVAHCQCSQVEISGATKEYLKKTQYDCLCKSCLSELNHMVKMTERYEFTNSPNLLVEKLHYYRENGFWVFTEFYHMLRGSCCGNGCKHCAYGYVKKEEVDNCLR